MALDFDKMREKVKEQENKSIFDKMREKNGIPTTKNNDIPINNNQPMQTTAKQNKDISTNIKANALSNDNLNKKIVEFTNQMNNTTNPTLKKSYQIAIDNLKSNQHQRIQKDKEEQQQNEAIKKNISGVVSNIVKPGAFEDGYQFGDVTKTAVSTVGDVATQGSKAVFGIGEGIIDAGMYGTGLISKAVGNEQFGNSMIEKANINAVDNAFKIFEKNIDKNSLIGDTGDEVVQGIAYALTLALPGVGAMKIAQLAGKTGKIAATLGTSATTFASSMGRGMSVAYNNGATDQEALTYGMIKGTADSVTELMFGGLGKALPILGYNKGALPVDDLLAQKLSSKVQSVITKNFVEAGVKMTAEGVEEVLAGILDAVGQKLTYMSEEDLLKLIEDQNLLEQFLMGSVVSGTMQAPGVVSNIKSKQAPYNNEIQQSQAVTQQEMEQKGVDIKGATQEFNQAVNNIQQQVGNNPNTSLNNEQPNINQDNPNQQMSISNNSLFQQSVENMKKEGYVIPQDRVDIIEKFSTNRGANVLFDNTLDNNINGVYDGKTRTYKINPNSEQSLEFIAVHEMLHDMQGTNEYNELSKLVQEYAENKNDYNEAKNEISNTYNSYLKEKGLSNNTLNMDIETTNDMVAEALGNQEFINSLVQKPSVFNKIVNWIKEMGTKVFGTEETRFLQELKKKFAIAYKQAHKGGSGISYSIQQDDNGKYVSVDVKQNIFEGKTLKQQKEIAKKYILQNFREKGLLKDNEKVNVSRKTANEYTNPKTPLSNTNLSNKLKASTEVDHLLAISKYKYSKSDNGSHPFAKNGWDYYETRFQVGNKMYTGLLNIGKSDRGKLLYDITSIKERINNISVKTESVVNSSIDNSITQSNTDVNNSISKNVKNNTKYSLNKDDKWQQFLKNNFDLMTNGTKTYITKQQDAKTEKIANDSIIQFNNKIKNGDIFTKANQGISNNPNEKEVDNILETIKMREMEQKGMEIMALQSEQAELETKLARAMAKITDEEAVTGKKDYEKYRKTYEEYNSKIEEIDKRINQLTTTKIANDSIIQFNNKMKKKDTFTNANQGKGRVADILINTESNKKSFKSKVADVWSALKRELVDSGDEINQLGKRTDDPLLYQLYNNAKQGWATTNYNLGKAQVDILGNKVGESLKDIFEPIRQKGDEYYKAFSTYIYEYHNIDRLKEAIKRGEPNKLKVTGHLESESRKMINEFNKEYPEFKELATKVWKYNENLLKYKVDAGLMSMEQATNYLKMYPHYVPTYRDTNGVSGSFVGSNTINIVNGKKATGSTKPLLPLHEQMARQTAQAIQSGRRNLLGMALYKNYQQNPSAFRDDILQLNKGKTDVMEVQALNRAYNEEQNGFAEEIEENIIDKPPIDNEFSFYVNGEKITLKVNDKLFSAIKDISTQNDNFVVIEAINSFNKVFKSSVTSWNPLFLITNHVKDMQDAGLYTDDVSKFIQKYPQAIKEISTNSKVWQKYQALGGFGSSFFDMQKGYKQDSKTTVGKVAKAPIEFIEQANYVVEQLPRFAEFLREMEGKDFNNYIDLQTAMLKAADITVNFGRSGRLGKTINKVVPFFNASIQGSSKAIREFSKKRNFKGAVLLASKVALLGIAPAIIGELLYGDDDDYKKLTEENKDLYYLFKTEDGQFIKIPKGRILSVLGALSRSAYKATKGDETAQNLGALAKFTLQQSGPINPFENFIGSAIGQAVRNETWYGTPIVNQSLENYKPSMQYDETTSEIAKSIGKTFNISPKKVHYVIDQMTGIIGDIVLPLTTKQAETGIVQKKFVLDSVTNNRLSGDFYDTIDELTQSKNDPNDANSKTSEYALKYLNDYKDKIQNYNKLVKKVQESSRSDKEKLERVRKYKKEVNNLTEKVLENYKEYGNIYNDYMLKFNDERKAKAYTDKSIESAEYAIKEYNSDVYLKYKKATDEGIAGNDFFRVYFAQKDITSDKDKNGNTIYLSESKNKKNAIDKAVPLATIKEKQYLYKMFNISTKVW